METITKHITMKKERVGHSVVFDSEENTVVDGQRTVSTEFLKSRVEHTFHDRTVIIVGDIPKNYKVTLENDTGEKQNLIVEGNVSGIVKVKSGSVSVEGRLSETGKIDVEKGNITVDNSVAGKLVIKEGNLDGNFRGDAKIGLGNVTIVSNVICASGRIFVEWGNITIMGELKDGDNQVGEIKPFNIETKNGVIKVNGVVLNPKISNIEDVQEFTNKGSRPGVCL